MLHAMPELGPLLASGRDADIFAYGPGLVVRRSRLGHSMEREAKVMQYVAARGFPAPRVEDVRAGGTELIMERIDGATMLDVLFRRPWTLRRNAARLATLHKRLHEIAAPGWLESFLGGNACIVHLDLHPLNVILSPNGPVLLDWTNARAGAAGAEDREDSRVSLVHERDGIEELVLAAEAATRTSAPHESSRVCTASFALGSSSTSRRMSLPLVTLMMVCPDSG